MEVQKRVFTRLEKSRYFKLPKQGTNPRGVEFTKETIESFLKDKDTMKIDINWKKEIFEYDTYKKWVEYWKED